VAELTWGAANEDRWLGVVLPATEPAGLPYGARSVAAVQVGELLTRTVPALAAGDLEIVAIARRVGVLSKIAVRRRGRTRLSGRPVGLVVGVGADRVNQVSAHLSGERLHVLQWLGDPARYIPSALGLGYTPPVELRPAARMATVLLGDIDRRGARGRQGLNVGLAAELTGWRIRLQEIARSPAWRLLELAQIEARTVPAVVQARVPKGLLVTVHGLFALLPIGQVRGVRRSTPAEQVDAILRARLGQELRVQVLRLDADGGRIIVAETDPAGRQLRLF
jgi:transcription antitermination factor NusA-like protein